MTADTPFDLLIIGGGVNGCGVARDAAGRGLSVLLCEMGDLAQATSSASTKLFHGGLRYLEHYEFRLVREALTEREILLRAMPHIAWPLRFVLPHRHGMRPVWLLRLGLFLYDHIGGRKLLPAAKTLDLRRDPAGEALQSAFTKAFEYSDCWVDDSRLVVLNARDAAANGAMIQPHTQLIDAHRQDGLWHAKLLDVRSSATRQIRARALVNAGGPWVDEIITNRLRANPPAKTRLVRGSHIVTKRLFDHDRCYVFQQPDGRIVFAIPYEQDFTLIGTTDREHQGDAATATCTLEEADYLRAAASAYLKHPIAAEDIVWTYSGVRPLYDDGAESASDATRDYVLELADQDGQAPVLSIFGGKITTYRRLAEAVLGKLAPYFPAMGGQWTAGAALPGGDFALADGPARQEALARSYPFLTAPWAGRLWRAYGTDATLMLGNASSKADLGQDFGGTLTEAEVRWLVANEWASTAQDILWRRSKLGLRLDQAQVSMLEEWLQNNAGDISSGNSNGLTLPN